MIIHGLEGRADEEAETLQLRHAGNFEGEACAKGVEEETLEGVVVEGAVGVGDVETVVAGVEGGVEVFVCVHEAVEEVLPGVDYEYCDGELEEGEENVVDAFGGEEFPGCESGD